MTNEPLPNGDPMAHLPPPSPAGPWRVLDRLVVVVFCLGLVVPLVMAVGGVRALPIENRPLATAPPVTIEGLVDTAFYGALDRFLAENLAIRRYAVRIRGEIYWRLGATGNPEVVRGIDGWSFTREEIVPTCSLSAADIAADLDAIEARLAGAGQAFRFVLAPDKHAVYPDKLDPGMPYGEACTDDQREAMGAEFARRPEFAIDGWTALAAERATPDGDGGLFFTEDSHWTPAGARPAIRELMRSLGDDLWDEDDFGPLRMRRFRQELARQSGRTVYASVPDRAARPTVTVEREALDLPVDVGNARAVYRFTATGDRPLVAGRTVIVYDSFFGIHMRAIAPYFEESVWIHQTDLRIHPELAELTGPFDLVILERVERGLYTTHIEDLLAPLVRD